MSAITETHGLFSKCFELHLVGSRVTCDPPPTNTDRDVLCFVENKEAFASLAEKEGFEAAGYVQAEQLHLTNSQFISLKNGECNLIVTDDLAFKNLFLVATRLAKRLNLLNRDDRVALFQAVLYGNG
jgi:hypothetical protein